MINTNDPVETYIGNGTLATYSFNFKVRSATDILIIVYDTTTGVLIFQERGNVLSNVSSVTFDAINGGGSITLPANLASQRKLIIVLAADTPTQTFKFRDQSEFDLRQFENALDNIMINVQRVNDKVNRSFRLSDKASYTTGLNMEIDSLPVASGVPIFDSTGTVVQFKTPAELALTVGPIVNGITTVADNTARDAIATGIRYQGMLVYVTSTLKNWQLQGGVANANWVDITAIVKTVADNTARNAITAGNRYQGMIVYVTSTSKNWQLQGGILDANWVDISVGVSGSSGGAENLVTNGTGEFAPVSIFTPYADAAGTRPVDGTGGSPNVTTALNSTNPINGTKDYTLIKDAVNRQGQGWAVTPITLPLAYRGKMLKLSIKYLVTSGTFVAGNNGTSPADGDIIWYGYDITNSKLVEPSNFKMFTSSTTFSDVYESSIQFDSNTASVRLIAHIASTSTAAYTLQVDDITLTPDKLSSVTPSVSFNAYKSSGNQNGSSGVNTFTSVNESHQGFNLSAGTYTIQVPGDYQVGFNEEWAAPQAVGFAFRVNGAVASGYSTSASSVYDGGNFLLRNLKVGDVLSVVSSTASVLSLTNFYFYGFKTAGQSQNSEPGDTRQEYFSATKTANQSLTNATATKLTFDSITNNSHGFWDAGNNRYIVQTAGIYDLSGYVGFAANATGVRHVYYQINGSTSEYFNQSANAGAGDATIIAFAQSTPLLKAGDYIELFGYQSSGGSLNVSFNLTRFRITRRSSPQAISASERIAVYKSFTASPSGTVNASYNNVIFSSVDGNTHGAYNTSTGNFIAPTAGLYLGILGVGLNATFTSGQQTIVRFGNSTSSLYYYGAFTATGSFTTTPDVQASGIVYANAGDVLVAQVYSNATSPTYSSSGAGSSFSIVRLS